MRDLSFNLAHLLHKSPQQLRNLAPTRDCFIRIVSVLKGILVTLRGARGHPAVHLKRLSGLSVEATRLLKMHLEAGPLLWRIVGPRKSARGVALWMYLQWSSNCCLPDYGLPAPGLAWLPLDLSSLTGA
jgi:hypothetical protein